MAEFDSRFNDSIQMHMKSNAYTDRKVAGAVIGTVIGSGIGFGAFGGAVSIGIGGCKSLLYIYHILKLYSY
jgi:predicted MFS family arabinose efflux permease